MVRMVPSEKGVPDHKMTSRTVGTGSRWTTDREGQRPWPSHPWNNVMHGGAAGAAVQRTLEDGCLGPPSGVRGLAVAIGGLIVMSLGSTPWVLAAGVIIWLAAGAVTVAGVLLVPAPASLSHDLGTGRCG